jgi:hypothetical protein
MVSVLKGEEPDEPPATLGEVLGRIPSWDELSGALLEGVIDVMGGDWRQGGVSDLEMSAASRWESRYRSDEWTWRM